VRKEREFYVADAGDDAWPASFGAATVRDEKAGGDRGEHIIATDRTGPQRRRGHSERERAGSEAQLSPIPRPAHIDVNAPEHVLEILLVPGAVVILLVEQAAVLQ